MNHQIKKFKNLKILGKTSPHFLEVIKVIMSCNKAVLIMMRIRNMKIILRTQAAITFKQWTLWSW
jgi:hypothetical protein